jgi:hypothetical protein
LRDIVMRDRQALHIDAARAVFEDAIEGRDAVGRDPAIGFVERQEAPGSGLHDRDQAQSHADDVGKGAAIVLEHVLAQPGRPDHGDVEREVAALRGKLQRHRFFARQDFMDQGREQRLEAGDVAPAGVRLQRLDEALHLRLGREPALGERDVAFESRLARPEGVAAPLGPRQRGAEPVQLGAQPGERVKRRRHGSSAAASSLAAMLRSVAAKASTACVLRTRAASIMRRISSSSSVPSCSRADCRASSSSRVSRSMSLSARMRSAFSAS